MKRRPIQLPHKYLPKIPHQLAFLQSRKRFKVVVWNRRAGKSKTALNQQIIRAHRRKGTYIYFLPNHRQAKRVIWDELIKTHVPMDLVEKLNESELAIYWKNGSIQRFLGCEDPDSHRGTNPIDVVFDEYSEMNERIWTEVIQPVLRENKGTATFVFTPKGRNHAWRLLEWARQYGMNEWYTDVRNVLDTQSHTPEEIEEARRTMPQALFEQEMMCAFLEDAGAFFHRVRENVWDGQLEPQPGYTYRIGVDLAKYQDWTVLTPVEVETGLVGQQERFNQTDWSYQKARIEAMSRRYNNALLRVDSTGVGDPIVEDLQRRGLAVDPYHFTETSRRQLLDNLAVQFEQDRLKLPLDDSLFSEIESMTMRLTPQGKVKVMCPENQHDDRVFSLALAVWSLGAALSQPKIAPTEHQKLEDFKLYGGNFE